VHGANRYRHGTRKSGMAGHTESCPLVSPFGEHAAFPKWDSSRAARQSRMGLPRSGNPSPGATAGSPSSADSSPLPSCQYPRIGQSLLAAHHDNVIVAILYLRIENSFKTIPTRSNAATNRDIAHLAPGQRPGAKRHANSPPPAFDHGIHLTVKHSDNQAAGRRSPKSLVTKR
jgi:hypothetical protein